MDVDPEVVERIKQYDLMAEANILSDVVLSDHIYVDIQMLKEINLGILFFLINDSRRKNEDIEKDYQYILSRLPDYVERTHLDWLSYFPELNITQDMVDECYEKYADFIIMGSPVTMFTHMIFSAHLQENSFNSRMVDKSDPITVYLNIYPFKEISDETYKRIGVTLGETFGVNVSIINIDPINMNINDVLQYDELYMYHYHRLNKNKSVLDGFSKLRCINQRYFITAFYSEHAVPDIVSDDTRKFIEGAHGPLTKQFKVLDLSQLTPDIEEVQSHD